MIKTKFPNIEDRPAEHRLIVDFYQAIFALDEARLFQLVADNCSYVAHGIEDYEGKPGLKKMLETVQKDGFDHVWIDSIVADKKHAAIKGVIVLQNGIQLACSEFLTFSPGPKIQRVDAYAVVTPLPGG